MRKPRRFKISFIKRLQLDDRQYSRIAAFFFSPLNLIHRRDAHDAIATMQYHRQVSGEKMIH